MEVATQIPNELGEDVERYEPPDDFPPDDPGHEGAELPDDEIEHPGAQIVTLQFVAEMSVSEAWQKAHDLIQSATAKGLELAHGAVADPEVGDI